MHAAALEIFTGVERGLAFPVGPVGAEPQVARTESFWPFGVVLGVLAPPAFDSLLAPVLPPLLEPIFAPVGFGADSTTIGTDVHALSNATRLVLDCVGIAKAATK